MIRLIATFSWTLLSVSAFAANFSLLSSDFTQNSMIPVFFTCNGTDTPPSLSWQNPPQNTQSLALVVQDPDAPSGAWTHWILFNIPPEVTQLSAKTLPAEARQAQNSWNNAKYQGPCPPLGAHRYVFTLYALDETLPLDNNAPLNTTLDAITGHVLGSASLTGLYQKPLPDGSQ